MFSSPTEFIQALLANRKFSLKLPNTTFVYHYSESYFFVVEEYHHDVKVMERSMQPHDFRHYNFVEEITYTETV